VSKFIDSIKRAIVEDDPDPKSSTSNQAHPEAKTSDSAVPSRQSVSGRSPGQRVFPFPGGRGRTRLQENLGENGLPIHTGCRHHS